MPTVRLLPPSLLISISSFPAPGLSRLGSRLRSQLARALGPGPECAPPQPPPPRTRSQSVCTCSFRLTRPAPSLWAWPRLPRVRSCRSCPGGVELLTFASAPPLPLINLVPASHRASGNSPRWLGVAAWRGLIRHVHVRGSLEGRGGPAQAPG